MPAQERALSDAELLAIFDDDRVDLSLLSSDEHTRLLTLTEQQNPDPSLLKRLQQDVQPMASHSPFTARVQADTRPGQYVRETLKNIPADLVEQAKNAATGTYDLLSVLAKATGEVGSDIGNFTREVIGLEPHYGGHENLQALGRVPGALASHYGQYADPEFRAERVREHPVGVAIDMAPVSAALKGGSALAKTGASVVARSPGRAIDTAIGLFRGSPSAAINGISGRGPVESARSVFAKMSSAPEATPAGAVAAPVAPPASSPATPAPSAAPSAPGSAPGRPAAPARSPQMIQNELGIQARRQGVKLTEPQYKAATTLVAQGRTPAEAVAEIAKATSPSTAASTTTAAPSSQAPSQSPKPKKAPARAKLTADEADEYLRLLEKGMTHDEAVAQLLTQRSLLRRLGTEAPEAVRRKVAERNATGKWPSDK